MVLGSFPLRLLVGLSWARNIFPWNILGADDLPVLQSIFTNFGTGFISAGLLLTFEPGIRKAVRRVADEAAADASDVVSEKLGTQLRNLQDQINQAIQARVRDQDEALGSLLEFTYDSALAAMMTAREIRAIDQDEITVEGTDEPGEFTVSLALRQKSLLGLPGQKSDSSLGRPSETEEACLWVMVEANGATSTQCWEPSEPFSQVALKLLEDLTVQKAWGYSKQAPWLVVIERLNEALVTAVKSQREDLDAPHHLKGRLSAVLTEGWFLTDAGLEVPAHSYLLSRSEFPERVDMRQEYLDLLRGKDRKTKTSDKPPWADQRLWEYAIKQCRSRYTKTMLGKTTIRNGQRVYGEPLSG